MSDSYSVQTTTIDALLAPNASAFEIPAFQRRYAWGAEQISELLADLFEDRKWALSDGAHSRPLYFLGSIVFAKSRTNTNTLLVLDGQQRLTTLSLLLAVLKRKLLDTGDQETAYKLQSYLSSGRLRGDESPKLRLQVEDALLYTRLVADAGASFDAAQQKSLLVAATKKISKEIEEYVESVAPKPTSAEAYLQMAERILYGVEIVTITAPSEAEAFRLFETLNDRGLALSAADLVKNLIFARCGEDSSSHLEEASELWKDIVRIVGATEIVDFLRYYWIAFEGEVRKQQLYDAYRAKVREFRRGDALDFVRDLRDAADLYQRIIQPDMPSHPWGTSIAEVLARLQALRSRGFRPLVLACSRQNFQFLPKLVRAIETVTIRYSVIGERNPSPLEGIYSKLCRLMSSDTEAFANALHEELSLVMPSDADFERTFREKYVADDTTNWRQVLVGLNALLATGETRLEGPNKVHVEHMLPRNPSTNALREAGLTRDEAESLSGLPGNLTLLSGRKNREASNAAFSHKKAILATSEIAMNAPLAQYSKWGKKEILKRTQQLADLAREAWPWPQS